jgi:hypothetical protein
MGEQAGAGCAGSSFALLCKTDVLRAPKFEHPVQRAHGNSDLDRAMSIRAES